jgi:hypothetical protein
MTWWNWTALWLISLAFTVVVAALAFTIGAWTFLVVFPSLFVGLGFVVTHD